MSGFVFTGASLGACAVGVDEPGPEGLTSTSLLDLLLPTDFEPLDSEEPSEAMGLDAGLAPGSGFPSEDSEESRLLQPPQYFWEEEELNGSSLDLGPTAGSSAHLLLHRTPESEPWGWGEKGRGMRQFLLQPLLLSSLVASRPPIICHGHISKTKFLLNSDYCFEPRHPHIQPGAGSQCKEPWPQQ